MNESPVPATPEQEKRVTRAAFVTRLAVMVACVYVLITTSAVVYLSIIGQQQRERLVDCTTPGHECYDEGNKRTGEAVLGILAGGKQNTIDVITAALSCQADGITEQEPLARCTVERSTSR